MQLVRWVTIPVFDTISTQPMLFYLFQKMQKERFAYLLHAETTKADRTTHHPSNTAKDLLPGVESVPLALRYKDHWGLLVTQQTKHVPDKAYSCTHMCMYINKNYRSISETSANVCISICLFRPGKTTAFLLCPEMAELTSTEEWSSPGIWHETPRVVRCGTSDQGLQFVLSHGNY